MLAQKNIDHLHTLIAQSSASELLWMSGYLAGLAAQSHLAENNNTNPKSTEVDTITIVYGTETGNAKKAATLATTSLKRAGIKTRLVAAENYTPELLEKETFILIVISTQGEGEPPAAAKPFYNYLHARKESLPNLRYGILALGSKSYPLFCQAGIDIDAQLNRLQAIQAIPSALCDDDYEGDAENWVQNLLESLQNPFAVSKVPTVIKRPAEGKKNFKGSLGKSTLLNDNGSGKKVYHLEFDLPEEIVYNPGNAVGVIPKNRQEEVGKILALLKIPDEQKIHYNNQAYTIETILKEKVSIQYLPPTIIKKYGLLTGTDIPETRMDLYDLLRIYPLQNLLQVQELIDLLPGITPRLYTISSSPALHPCQIHLTVQMHNFQSKEEVMSGLASEFMTTILPGTELDFFLHTQKSFQLPPDEKDIIMIAQGTGIAPFRSFLSERDTIGATGKSWLFFGEENRVTDFYYQAEMQQWVSTGALHSIDTAFTKNTMQPSTLAEKLLLRADEIWQWLEKGSYLMISGEKEPAGKAVEAALLQLISKKMDGDEKKAGLFIKQLQKEGRYAKELY